MLWNDLPADIQHEIEALPTTADQFEAWLMLHRVGQLAASLEEQCRIFDAVCASTNDAVKKLQAFLAERVALPEPPPPPVGVPMG